MTIPLNPFQLAPERPPDKVVRPIPPNLGHGNSVFSSLWYHLFRESVRALARSILGVELDKVGSTTVSAGHRHNDDQETALDWWPVATAAPWFAQSVANTPPGSVAVKSITETDRVWFPVVIPGGASLIYPKVRLGLAASSDSIRVHLEFFAAGDLNTVVFEGGHYTLKNEGVGATAGVWREFDPIDVSSASVVDGEKFLWCKVSVHNLLSFETAYLQEVCFALREGL